MAAPPHLSPAPGSPGDARLRPPARCAAAGGPPLGALGPRFHGSCPSGDEQRGSRAARGEALRGFFPGRAAGKPSPNPPQSATATAGPTFGVHQAICPAPRPRVAPGALLRPPLQRPSPRQPTRAHQSFPLLLPMCPPPQELPTAVVVLECAADPSHLHVLSREDFCSANHSPELVVRREASPSALRCVASLPLGAERAADGRLLEAGRVELGRGGRSRTNSCFARCFREAQWHNNQGSRPARASSEHARAGDLCDDCACLNDAAPQALAQAAAADVGLPLPAKSLPLGATDATAFTQAGFHAVTLQARSLRTGKVAPVSPCRAVSSCSVASTAVHGGSAQAPFA